MNTKTRLLRERAEAAFKYAHFRTFSDAEPLRPRTGTILAPFAETVQDRFASWLSTQEASGGRFAPEQREWLQIVRDQVAASLTVEAEDFEYVPFNEKGAWARLALSSVLAYCRC